MSIASRTLAAISAAAMLGTLIASPVLRADTFTLERAVLQALAVAPEIRRAEAAVQVRRGELTQARAWPNPTVEARAGDRLAKEEQTSGYDLTQLSIIQPLAFGRRKSQRQNAQSSLDGAVADRRRQQLELEAEVARAFHAFQGVTAASELAAQRLRLAESFGTKSARARTGDPLVRYVTPLERLRLGIIRESAQQAVDTAEGELSEVRARLKALLALPIAEPVAVALDTPPTPENLSVLEARLEQHPAIVAAQHALAAAQHGIDVARSQRRTDTAVSLTRERDVIAGGRDDVTSLGLSVQVPLWNRNNGGVERAKAESDKARAELDIVRRDLAAQLRQSHAHLHHLIDQAEHYRTKVLEPSERMFNLTRKAFAAGEVNVLTLIDANGAYFDARERYLELLQQGWREAAALRLAAGVSLTETNL